ncbi:hypothetical protein DZC78_06025 [Olleya aquimaris]|nr:hypothetical protein DZC78_06025 [Olleya aquimaris]
MSWVIMLFKAKDKIPSDLDFDDSILEPTVFSDILGKSFSQIIIDKNHREIKGSNFSIDYFIDNEPTGVKMLNLYGENGLFELIELAKVYNWQVYDTSLNEFIDLENPEKNGFENHRKYVEHIRNRK